MRGKFLVLLLAVSFTFLLCVPLVKADDTAGEIKELKAQIKMLMQRIEKLEAQQKKVVEKTPAGIEKRVTDLEKKADSFKLPKWVKNVKLKGDLRLRNEYTHNKPGKDRNRQRIRFRVGVTTKVNDKIKLGFGLATGDTNTPTSTNQTLQQEFSSKNIWLDYVYAKYTPLDWLMFEGGKFKSPYFHTDMLWDSDVRFDGFAGQIIRKFNKDGKAPTKVSLTAGFYPIDERSTMDDIFMAAYQIASETKFKDVAKLKAGFALYDFHGLKNYPTGSIAYARGTNTAQNGRLRYNYRVISPTVKLGLPNLIKINSFKIPVGLIGEYAHNTAAPKFNDAWRAGFWLGQSKVKKKGQWRILAQYSRLEKDAFYEVFPDADFNGGGTNAKGWEIIIDYSIAKNVILSLDYYNTKAISGPEADQQILQTDVIFKF